MFWKKLIEYLAVVITGVFIQAYLGKPALIFFAFLYLAFYIYRYIKNIPVCKKCNIRMKLKRIEDPISFNVSDKVRVSFIKTKGIPIKEKVTYYCKNCNKTFTREEYRVK